MIPFDLNIDDVVRNLCAEHGISAGDAAVGRWLARAGASRLDNRWVVTTPAALNLFHPGELAEPCSPRPGASIAPEPATQYLTVPKILTEPHREARRSWRKVANKALVAGTWGTALEELEPIPIASVAGDVLLSGPVPFTHGQHILAYLIRDQLREAVGSRRLTPLARAASERALLIEGSERFWFCLGFLCGGLPLLPPFAQLEDAQFAESVLWALIRFWPDLVALSPRFMLVDGVVRRWPNWITVAQYLVPLIGASQNEMASIKQAEPMTGGRILGRLLIRCYQ